MLVAPVRVGARSVTAAGSVVTRDVPPDTLVAGVPAQIKKSLKDAGQAAGDERSEGAPAPDAEEVLDAPA
jgi:acetyltransferase-like isoleucine patch superfamily enzyme